MGCGGRGGWTAFIDSPRTRSPSLWTSLASVSPRFSYTPRSPYVRAPNGDTLENILRTTLQIPVGGSGGTEVLRERRLRSGTRAPKGYRHER